MLELTIDQKIEILKFATQLATAQLMTELDFLGNLEATYDKMINMVTSDRIAFTKV